MIFLVLFLYLLPVKESMVYETNDKGKIGTMNISSEKDSLGYHVFYRWERTVEIILDSLNFSTLYVKKIVNNKIELEASQEESFKVNFKGRKFVYREGKPVYDRHALEFALRGFEYYENFKQTVRLHVPEFMIINAEIEVVDDAVVSGPIGDIPCWKIQMTPRILFIRWRFYFWIEKDYPYRFVRYEDSSGENSILLIEYEGVDSR
jgi:hypothetical protein